MVGYRRSIALSMILLVSIGTGIILNQSCSEDASFNPLRLVQRPTSVQTRDDAELLSGWLDKVDNSWEVGKNHQKVRSAFADVVSDARDSTVRILRDGEQVAMGTVVDADGLILTKASEVKNADRLVCQFANKRQRTAQIVDVKPSHDLALLRVRASNLTPVKWHQGSAPAVGSLLATPGLGREPLAIGVVSLAPQEVKNDGVLGIRLRNGRSGPIITDVIEESAAEDAGLIDGDVVLRINKEVVRSSDELVSIVSRRLPGDEVRLLIRRENEEMTLRAILGRRADLDLENSDFQSFLGGKLSSRRSGFPSVLQHDTFLMPQHCGGPIVDLDGRVVGINIARAERIASYALTGDEIEPWINKYRGDETVVAGVSRGKGTGGGGD